MRMHPLQHIPEENILNETLPAPNIQLLYLFPHRTTPLPLLSTTRASGVPLATVWTRSVMWSCQNWPWGTGSTLMTWELTRSQLSPPSTAFWDPRSTTVSARPTGTPFYSPCPVFFSLIPRPNPVSYPDPTQVSYPTQSHTQPSLIPRPNPVSYPGPTQSHTQAQPSLIPRPNPVSYPT